jgi:hypothetical protein
MPTRKSLNDSWYAQFILGLSEEQYTCQDHNPEYAPKKDNSLELKGEKLGEIIYNPKTGRMTIESTVKKD